MDNIIIKEVVNLAAGDAVIFTIPNEYMMIKHAGEAFRDIKAELDMVGIKAIFINEDIEVDVFRSEDSES